MEKSRPSVLGVTGWIAALGFASGCYPTSDTFNIGLGSAICLRALPPNSTCITS
uniref:Lipoprotein n=1 Tax=Amphimedon queenslandica TaxID=400682 RepID=A0A1X7UBY4_AMPQE